MSVSTRPDVPVAEGLGSTGSVTLVGAGPGAPIC